MTIGSLLGLLGQPPRSGLYRIGTRTSADRIETLASERGWRCYRLDGREPTDKAAFLAYAGRVLGFPAYYGRNWDAFEECLNGLGVEPPAPVLVLMVHTAVFASAAPEAFDTAIDIFSAAAGSAAPRPLVVLLQGVRRSVPHLHWL